MIGIITRSDRQGGVINSPQNGDVEFSWADVQRGVRLTQGQEVEYEVRSQGGQQKAVNVRPCRQQQPMKVTTRFGEPADSANDRAVPCTVTLERGNNPVVDVKVRLTVNGVRQTYPLSEPKTDSFGNVYFAILLSVGEVQADVAVEVNNNGYSCTWKYSKPKPQLTVTESQGVEWKNLVLTFADGELLIPVTFEVWPTNGCTIAWREAGVSRWKLTTGKFEIPTTGRSILQFKIDKALKGVGGENIFVGVKGFTAQSGPHYVSGNL